MIQYILKEVQERTRSQVVTSFIIILVLNHWEILFRATDFDISVIQRIEILKELSYGSFGLDLICNLILPLLAAFVAAFLFHGVNTVGKWITHLWNEVWWPKIKHKTKPYEIKSKEEYDQLMEDLENQKDDNIKILTKLNEFRDVHTQLDSTTTELGKQKKSLEHVTQLYHGFKGNFHQFLQELRNAQLDPWLSSIRDRGAQQVPSIIQLLEDMNEHYTPNGDGNIKAALRKLT